MHKKKIITAGLAVAIIGATGLTLVGCSSVSKELINNKTDTGKGDLFAKNAGIREFAKQTLMLKTGQQSILDSMTDAVLYNWYQKATSNRISEQWKTWTDAVNDQYNDLVKKYKSDRGADWEFYLQQDELDAAGGTEGSWKYQQMTSKLKDDFTTRLFENDYLGLENTDGTINSNPSHGQLNDAANINANPKHVDDQGVKLNTNNFIFSPKTLGSDAYQIDTGYSNLINYIFSQWLTQDMPIPTSMILFKDTAPVSGTTSKWFNVPYFTSDTVGTDGSYKFQVFPKPNPISGTLNASDKYAAFYNGVNATGGDEYIDTTTGAISFPQALTDDSSTSLVATGTSIFNDLYTPYAAAVMYQFNNDLGLVKNGNVANNSTFIDPGKVGSFTKDAIMRNFLSTNASNGYFTFPTAVTDGLTNGQYGGFTSVADTVTIGSTPYITTRDEAGVHIIAIDRDSKVQAAAFGLKGQDAIDAAMKENGNTIRWRGALQKYSDSNATGLNLQDSMKTYFSANLDRIILQYAFTSEDYTPNKDSIYATGDAKGKKIDTAYAKAKEQKDGTWYVDTNGDNKKGKDESEIINPNLFSSSFSVKTKFQAPIEKYLNASLELQHVESQASYVETVSSKMYANQSAYGDNTKEIKANGIAGVLPYTRNAKGNFDNLDKIMDPSGTTDWDVAQKAALQKYSDAIYKDEKTPSFLNPIAKGKKADDSDKFINIAKMDNVPKYSQYILTNNEMVNTAVEATSSSSEMSRVLQTQTMLDQLSSGDWYDAATDKVSVDKQGDINTIDNQSSNTDKARYINYYIQHALDSIYKLSSFTGQDNLYKNGDWKTADDVMTIADNLWNSNYNKNYLEGAMQTNDTSMQYLTTLITMQYLLGYDANSKTYSFKPLTDYLNAELNDNSKAVVAWVDQENTGLKTSYGDVEPQTAGDFKFNANPINLTKANSYMYSGATDATTPTYTTDTNYWNVVPATTGGKEFTGFMGLQFQNSNNLPSVIAPIVFDDWGYSGPEANTGDNLHPGLLYNYNYVSDTAKNTKASNGYSNLITAVGNVNTVSGLEKIINTLDSFSLPNDWTAASIENKDTGETTNYTLQERKQNLLNGTGIKKETAGLVADSTSDDSNNARWIHEDSFAKQTSKSLKDAKGIKYVTPEGDGSAYGYEVIVTQVGTDDVDGLITKDANEKDTIDLSTNGFLGLPPEAFFDSVLKLASDQTLQEDAISNMLSGKDNGNQDKLTVYDKRFFDALGSLWIKNWN